ncbi:MAG: PEP-CTERM sorting domain-containing protein, partial [Alphaproteobacteria bacterium]
DRYRVSFAGVRAEAARVRQAEADRRAAELAAIEPGHVLVVSGLPRSGTSLMMQMLRAGGTTSNLSNLFLGGSLLDSVGNPLAPTERGYFTTSHSGQDVLLNIVAVPEPSTLALVGIGAALAAWVARGRRAPWDVRLPSAC